jgi:hypothetical protein
MEHIKYARDVEASPRASHGDVDTAITRTLPVQCFLLSFNDNSTHYVTFKLFGSVPHFVLSQSKRFCSSFVSMVITLNKNLLIKQRRQANKQ